MSIIKSLFTGSEGSYKVLGIPVDFHKELPPNTLLLSSENLALNYALKCLKSRVFCLATTAYVHLLVHEMGHALIGKFLLNQNTRVGIYTKDCVSATISSSSSAPSWKKTIRYAAGPIANLIFSSGKLVSAALLRSYLPFPLSPILASGTLYWMVCEMCHAAVSAKEKKGDFGKIALNGTVHLGLASTALITQCALGIFAAVKMC